VSQCVRAKDCTARTVLFNVVRSMVAIQKCKGGCSRGIAIKSLQKLPHGGAGLEVERSHNVNELDRAQAPFSAFIFGDKGLRLAEPRGDTCLRQTALIAKITQQLAELDLARRAQRVAHCLKPGALLTASPHNPDLGLSHFGISSTWSLADCGE
jgi:hypothetical protein